jgi:hypothetical protein
LIELNKKRLTPQKQLQALLANLKDTPKNIYEESLPAYLASIEQLLPAQTKSGKSKETK